LLGQGCNTLFVLLVILLCWVDKMAAWPWPGSGRVSGWGFTMGPLAF
jgi:hypothetical protein